MMCTKGRFLLFLFVLQFCNCALAAQIRLDVGGVLDELVIGTFSSTAFTASFLYQTDISLATGMAMEAPNDVSYIFNTPAYFGNAIIGNPINPTYDVLYEGIEVGVANNFVIAMDDFPGVPAGTYDQFGMVSSSPGAIFDSEGVLSTGIQIGLLFFTGTGFFSDVNSIPSAPPFSTGDIGQFFVFDFTNDIVNRAAVGTINSLTTTIVPIPAGIWFLISGLIVLLRAHWRIPDIKNA